LRQAKLGASCGEKDTGSQFGEGTEADRNNGLQERAAYGSILNMVAVREIKAFCRRLAVEYRPRRIVLFGSYARGEPRPDSDVDLLVVMAFKGSGVSKAAEMIRKLSPSFAVDLVIRTPDDVENRVAMNDFFLKEATNGRLLYEAPDA